MKNYKKSILRITLFYSLVILLAACAKDNEIVVPQAQINALNTASVNVGDELTLTGKNIHLITKVTFRDHVISPKDTIIYVETPVSQELYSRDRSSLTVVVPTLSRSQDNVTIEATYNSTKRIVVSGALVVNVPPVIPTVELQPLLTVNSGDIITIKGTDLNIIKTIKVGESNVAIRSITTTQLTFVAPEVESEITATVVLSYDNSIGPDQQLTAIESLTIKPLITTNVEIWDVTIGGQATGLSFFNASTGKIIPPCEVFDNQAQVDFMMNVSSAGENQFYNPANSMNVLKNQKCGELSLGVAIDAGGDGKDYSTFLAVNTKFRLLSTTNTAQNALIEKVKAGDITELSAGVFEGITAPSSNTPKNFNPGDILWFLNDTKAKNGLIEIKEIIPGNTPEESKIEMRVYYQK